MRKWTTILLVAFGLMLISGSVMAQEATPEVAADAGGVFCGTLAEADCTLLQQSHTAMDTLTSASFDFNLAVDITDAESAETHTITVAGTGAYANRPAGATMDMMNPMGMMAALGQLQADLSLTVTLPAALMAELQEDAAGTLPESLDLQVRLVNGVGYVNAESIKPFLESAMGEAAPPEFSGWIGIDLGRLFGALLSDPDFMGAMDFGSMNAETAALMSALSTFQDSVNITRSDDANGAAVFTSTFDFALLASNPAFADMLREQAAASGEPIDEDELQAGLAALSDAGDALVLTSTQTIDPATGYLQNATVSLDFDGSQLPEMDGSSSDDIPTIALSLSVNIGDHNAVAEITAPEDATMAPEEFYTGISKTGHADMAEAATVEAPAEVTPEVTTSP